MYADRAKKYNEDKEKEEIEKRRVAELQAAAAKQQQLQQPPPPSVSPGGMMGHMRAGSPGINNRVRNESGGQMRADPLFHVVPPKPQRLLHSEAYIKYIEGLSKDTNTMCNWNKQLQATNQVISM